MEGEKPVSNKNILDGAFLFLVIRGISNIIIELKLA